MSTPITVHKLSQFSGHRDCIYILEKDLNPNIFYSGSGDGMVVKWDITAPENGELLIKVPNSVYSLKLIEEENQLLVGHNFEGIHLVDLNEKKEIRSVKLTSSYIFDISTWEDKIIAACGDGEVIVLNKDNFSRIYSIKVTDKSARSISINPLLKEIAVGYSDNNIRIYSLEDFSLKQVISGHTLSVFTVKYSPDFKFLFSGSRDAHLKIWDCWNHYSLHQSIVAHMYAINHIDFSPDAALFATASMDKTVKIWDMRALKLLKVIDKSRYQGHATSVNRVLWTSFPNKLLSASDDKSICLWEVER